MGVGIAFFDKIPLLRVYSRKLKLATKKLAFQSPLIGTENVRLLQNATGAAGCYGQAVQTVFFTLRKRI